MSDASIMQISFTPDAVKEHFDYLTPDPLEGLTDEEIAQVGNLALEWFSGDDIMWNLFDEHLSNAVNEVKRYKVKEGK